jgi:hypothetical protein
LTSLQPETAAKYHQLQEVKKRRSYSREKKMKHTIRKDVTMKFLMAPMAVLVWTSFLFAQTDGSTAKDQTGTTMKMHGKVVSVDAKANTIIVETKRSVITLAVASGSKIMLGMMELSKEITLNEIQNGTSVSITWELIDGKKTATNIVVNSAADAKWKKGI